MNPANGSCYEMCPPGFDINFANGKCYKKLEFDSCSNNQTKIQVAEINVYSRQENLDADMNGIPDPIEIAAQSLKAGCDLVLYAHFDAKDIIAIAEAIKCWTATAEDK